jgi:putative N6-adenine-specific DNA methylase
LDSYFAVTAPGLEPFTSRELTDLGLLAVPALEKTSQAGVAFKGDLPALYRANLHLRTASRILAKLGTFFYATTYPELQKRSSRLPWDRFLSPGQPIVLRVTCHQSKLYNSEAVARIVSAGLGQRLGKACPLVKADEETDGHPPQMIVVRLVDDKCTISVDSSGELLHKRGYRLAVAKAPLRETLAAALLMASGWDTSAPLLDPFCGSGTIPIEAALMQLGLPPGLNRRFAFMDWPGFEPFAFNDQLSAIRDQQSTITNQQSAIGILASDRDAGAIRMAHENAARAGVEDAIEIKCQAVSSITPPPGPGWIVTNPPYGVRVSQGRDLRNLYAQFGNVLRRQCPGWNVAVLCNDPVLLGQMQMQLDTSFGFTNGGIGVRLARAVVPTL